MVFKIHKHIVCRRKNNEGAFAVDLLEGFAGLSFSIVEELFSLWSEIRVEIDIVMIVLQNKLWNYRMDREVLGSKQDSKGV